MCAVESKIYCHRQKVLYACHTIFMTAESSSLQKLIEQTNYERT